MNAVLLCLAIGLTATSGVFLWLYLAADAALGRSRALVTKLREQLLDAECSRHLGDAHLHASWTIQQDGALQ